MKYYWLRLLEIDDLEGPFRELADEIGLENTRIVMEKFDGRQQYFRKIRIALLNCRNRFIRRKWTGHNLVELAAEFDLTDRQIREIVRDDPAQEELFPGTHSARNPR